MPTLLAPSLGERPACSDSRSCRLSTLESSNRTSDADKASTTPRFRSWPSGPDTPEPSLRNCDNCRPREDWAITAASHLLLDGFAQKEDKRPPSGPLAAPLACNQSQEETLDRLRREPLTVVTGPPGTGKTQLVVNAVTNAWLDGDKVLVTSTNNGAVDVAVDRAEKDVSSGLLVRTGKHSVRQQVPDRITAALAQAAAHCGSRAAARAQLKRVATERAQMMEKLARLDELDLQLLQVVKEQEELGPAWKEAARTLWTNASPPELPISSHVIERRASRLLRGVVVP